MQHPRVLQCPALPSGFLGSRRWVCIVLTIYRCTPDHPVGVWQRRSNLSLNFLMSTERPVTAYFKKLQYLYHVQFLIIGKDCIHPTSHLLPSPGDREVMYAIAIGVQAHVDGTWAGGIVYYWSTESALRSFVSGMWMIWLLPMKA